MNNSQTKPKRSGSNGRAPLTSAATTLLPSISRKGVDIYTGDCRELLPQFGECSFHCCVTSPPYWKQRDYDHADQIGSEPTIPDYLDTMVTVFRGVRRTLRDDGTLWLNLGDKYEDKQLLGLPWKVAFALQDDGWILRNDNVWHKPNLLPESVKDRCTKDHEYVFLFAKSRKYYFDQAAVKVPASPDTHARYARGRSEDHKWKDGGPGNQTIARSMEHMAGVNPKAAANASGNRQNASFSNAVKDVVGERNLRTVWSIPAKGYKGAHFATFPEALVLPCLLAGCPEGGTVLDPFFGSGTTAAVAIRNGCKCVGIEVNAEYVQLAAGRFEQPLLLSG